MSSSSSSSSFDYNQYKQQLGRIHNIIDDLNSDLDQSYSQLTKYGKPSQTWLEIQEQQVRQYKLLNDLNKK
jgi:hypothetical protein